MGSLFVGPYRQNNINGLCSKTIAYNLINSIPIEQKLLCRNLYIDPTAVTEFNDNNILRHETYDKVNQLIQHVPPNAIYLSQYLDYNICIPILNNQILKDEYIYRLSLCNKVFIDNELDYQRLQPYLSNIQHISYEPIILNDTNQDLNLGVFNNTHKFYFIGSFQNNKDLLIDMILSFVVFSQTNDNISLLLLLTNTNKKEIDLLQNIINATYKQLNINNVFIKIVCINLPMNLSTIINYHNYCDTYLNINDDNHSSFNTNYAKKFNNTIIDAHNLKYENKIMRNDIVSHDGFYVPIQNTIIEAFRNYTANQSNVSYEKIGNAIWN